MELPNPSHLLLIYFGFLLLGSSAAVIGSDDGRSVYIVHMDKSQMPIPFSTHHHWYASILQSSSDALIYAYDHVFHGFSALLSQQEVEALHTSPGFISAYPDAIHAEPDTTRSIDFLGLTTVSGLWPAAQLGKDVIIGVMDTGIWPESPSFRDTGIGKIPARWKGICQEGDQFNSSMCNNKLIGARYFNRAIRAANPGEVIPINSARDYSGHGTHVASTAAGSFVDGVSYFGYANGTARGVAPAARIAAYKVLWNIGVGGAGADILAGIDQALADGVDIISISLSITDNINLYENPLSIASFGAREKGVVVVFSAGNRGFSSFSIREKGIPWGIVVAAGTVDRWFAGTLSLGNGKSMTGWSLYPGSASIKNLPIVYNETLALCESRLPEPARGGILVCNLSLDFVYLSHKIHSLQESGARAAIVISDFIAEDRSLYSPDTFTFPLTVISPAKGQELLKYVSQTAAPRASIDFHETVIGPAGPRPAPALGSFSSRGPARNYQHILKPDIMAPGLLILAAYRPNTFAIRIGNTSLFTNYPLLFGTSMSCPHISGVAALLKSAHPDWSPSVIQSAMMTTANPLNNANQPIREFDGFLTSPLDIGSGHVDPNRAMDPGLVYDNTVQDFVNFVCALNFTANQTRTLIRSSYNCSNPSSDLNYPSIITVYLLRDEGRIMRRRYQRTVTNVGNGAVTYRVRVEAPKNVTVTVRPQRLVFRRRYEKQSYTVNVRFVPGQELGDGSITWIDTTGKHNVSIPMVITQGREFF